MRKLIVLLGAVVSVGLAARAVVVEDLAIYWQIDFGELWTENSTMNWGDTSLSDPAVIAQLMVSYADVTEAQGVDYFFKEDGVTSFKVIGLGDLPGDDINWSNLDGASFYVELYGVNGDYLAQSEAVTFNDLLNKYNAVDVDFAPDHLVINHSSMWMAINYTPEPNSALLVLLGLAGLSLRRRRV